jgi:hypothetical protein
MRLYELTNLWSAYNQEEDFRVLVLADTADKAETIACGYGKDSNFNGSWCVQPTDAVDIEHTHFDCDYVLTDNDKSDVTVEPESNLSLLKVIKENESAQTQFVNDLIEVFNNFLTKRGIDIPNDEKTVPEAAFKDVPNIFGSDETELKSSIQNCVVKWDSNNIVREVIEEVHEFEKFGFVKTRQSRYKCPNCNSVLNAGPMYQPEHCSKCGQKVSFANIVWKPEEVIGYTTHDFPPKEDK